MNESEIYRLLRSMHILRDLTRENVEDEQDKKDLDEIGKLLISLKKRNSCYKYEFME